MGDNSSGKDCTDKKESAPRIGAPSFPWTLEIEDEIFTRLARGEALVDICADDWLPGQTTVYKRLSSDVEFAKRYARAREVQADTLFDEILQIADDGRNDWMERKGQDALGYAENGEALRRSQLRIDARKWMAGKLRPKVYGEKLELRGAGESGEIIFKTVYEGQ
jgi:hypothetical protein